MALYSLNQTRHVYVVKSLKTTGEPAAAGDIKVVKTSDNQIYFKYYGMGGPLRSDLIDINSINYAHLTAKEDLRRYLKKATIKLSSSVNSGNPISGQDYIVRITIRNYITLGDDSTMIKNGMVHAYAGMTATQFYTKLKESLENNFSRDAYQPFKFTASATGVDIEELEQDWTLGIKQLRPVNFEVTCSPVVYQGEEVSWIDTTNNVVPLVDTTNYVKNGKDIADLEYFCMGERGDQYRNLGWPYVIPTKYMVDSSTEYDVIDMHYAFTGSGVDSYKSEKDITFVCSDSTVMTSLKAAIVTAGITVTTKPAATEDSDTE